MTLKIMGWCNGCHKLTSSNKVEDKNGSYFICMSCGFKLNEFFKHSPPDDCDEDGYDWTDEDLDDGD
jgi:hypothetical protein